MTRSALGSRRRGALPALLFATACVATTWLAYGWIMGLALLGWDSYPLIAAARIDSLGAFIGTFAEELMDGRYADGHFYRPVTHLSFALDHALGGLAPAGYHRTDLALAALAATLVACVARRLVGGVLGPLAAGTFFLLHPAQLDILPYSPRRADTLAIAFTLATLLCVGRARAPWTALCALLALGAKETGLLVLPLAAAWCLLVAREREVARIDVTWRAALRPMLPVVLATLAFMLVRTTVLGGLGGHAESGAAALGGVGAALRELGALTLGPAESLSVAWVALPFVLGALLATRERRSALAWIAVAAGCAAALTAVAGRAHPWYALLLVLPMSFLGALIVAEGRARLAARPLRALDAAPIITALGALVAVGALARVGGLAPREPAFRVASDGAWSALNRIGEALPAAAPGQRALVQPWVPFVARERGTIFVHAPYTLAAYVECLAPELPVTAVAFDPAREPAPDPLHWVLVLAP